MNNFSQLQQMAEYNKLMNQRLYQASSNLSTTELTEDKGAFFKSILGTLNHIMVGDIIWLNRFSQIYNQTKTNHKPLDYITKIEQPKSLDDILFTSFNDLKEQREKIDLIIIDWIKSLSSTDLDSVISYKNMQGKHYNKLLVDLINHLFLHQIHHRGQITTLLSQASIDFGETDMLEIIPDLPITISK